MSIGHDWNTLILSQFRVDRSADVCTYSRYTQTFLHMLNISIFKGEIWKFQDSGFSWDSSRLNSRPVSSLTLFTRQVKPPPHGEVVEATPVSGLFLLGCWGTGRQLSQSWHPETLRQCFWLKSVPSCIVSYRINFVSKIFFLKVLFMDQWYQHPWGNSLGMEISQVLPQTYWLEPVF